jgi:hypothetical protein
MLSMSGMPQPPKLAIGSNTRTERSTSRLASATNVVVAPTQAVAVSSVAPTQQPIAVALQPALTALLPATVVATSSAAVVRSPSVVPSPIVHSHREHSHGGHHKTVEELLLAAKARLASKYVRHGARSSWTSTSTLSTTSATTTSTTTSTSAPETPDPSDYFMKDSLFADSLDLEQRLGLHKKVKSESEDEEDYMADFHKAFDVLHLAHLAQDSHPHATTADETYMDDSIFNLLKEKLAKR